MYMGFDPLLQHNTQPAAPQRSKQEHDEAYDFKSVDQEVRQQLQNRKHNTVHLKKQKSDHKTTKIALIGWSLASIEAIDTLDIPFVVVSLPEFESYANQYQIPFVSWEFDKKISCEEVYDQSEALYEKLNEMDVNHAIPIFEETVEWAGALNARFSDSLRIFYHSLLFRNKAMMKRKAQLGGLRVGVFEEGNNKEDVRKFFKRMNQVLLKVADSEQDPIHVKALDKAGSARHRIICSDEDIDHKLTEDNFPCLMESHLEGIEVSCEVFIHKGKIRFLNITEYVVFGYSMMVPPSPKVEKLRPLIRDQVQKVIDAFEIEQGMIHPEFFIDEEGQFYFGEVAYRIPGGHIFDLMQKAYQFNPFQGHILCCNPNTTEEQLRDFFPDEKKNKGHAGSFLVYPKVKYINGVQIPKDLEELPGFDRHTIVMPAERNVMEVEGYGNHYGTIFFYGDDCEQVRQPLQDYINHDFYV